MLKPHEEKAYARVGSQSNSALSLGTSETGLLHLAKKGLVAMREVHVYYGDKDRKHATLVREFKKNESKRP